MIIFKRKHLSIKWGIFAGILVFLAILLLLLFLLQTVYLDDIYKAAKKNTLNNANDKVEQVLEKQLGNLNVIEQQLDELTAEYDIDIQISGEDGTLLYSSLRMYENTLPKQFYQGFYKRAKENGGGFTEEFAGDIQRDPFELLTQNGELPEKPTGDGNEAGQLPQNENTGNGVSLDQTPPSGIAQESMVSVRILTISSIPYLTIVSARLTPVNATVQMIRQELI